MRLTVLVNETSGLLPMQSTALLALRAAARGHEVEVSGVRELVRGDPGGTWARGRRVPALGTVDDVVEQLAAQTASSRRLVAGDAVLVRTNPGRDSGAERFHAAAMDLLRAAEDDGVVVLNPPDVLTRTGGKGYLMRLPAELRPLSLVAAEPTAVREFVESRGTPSVLKPVFGTRGTDVFKVQGGPDGGTDAERLAREMLGSGPVMVQEFVPEAARGDTRLLLVDGLPLTVAGRRAAVLRRPPPGDFRSNLAVGGQALPAEWTPALEKVMEQVGPVLRRDGIWLAGVDVIGSKVVEVNVHSPGGFGSAMDLEGPDFADALIAALERRVAEGTSSPPTTD